jgi:hypothetical protein|eukprot:31071-Pelagococcus_subviridis.AAC.13
MGTSVKKNLPCDATVSIHRAIVVSETHSLWRSSRSLRTAASSTGVGFALAPSAAHRSASGFLRAVMTSSRTTSKKESASAVATARKKAP